MSLRPARPNLISYFDELSRFGRRKMYIWREGVRWRSQSYGDLHRHSLVLASVLHGAGVRPGDAVLLQGPETARWVEALYAIFRVGGVVIPLSPDTPASMRARVARSADARWLLAPHVITAPDGCRHVTLDTNYGECPGPLPEVETGLDDRAEIIFTSGTTGEPRGVILTHRNLIADFAPLERLYDRLGFLAAPAHGRPVLLAVPLSHMFGQALGIFLLPHMGFTVVLTRPRPLDVIDAARRMGAWGLITVPRVLQLLAQQLCTELPANRQATSDSEHAADHRRFSRPDRRCVRRLLGWRFRFLFSGGAALNPSLHSFWRQLGFFVSEGYGLTETAPIISLSNPFRSEKGVGRPFSHQQVRLADDAEILVKGENVSPGYLGGDGLSPRLGEWLETGDVGEFDEAGHLIIKGRKKDVIVTAEGENVYPRDVEEVLSTIPGVRDSCVLGWPGSAGDDVCAVLLLEADASPFAVVERANRRLLPKQRIRNHTVWPRDDFPRTVTGKIEKAKVLACLGGGSLNSPPARPEPSGDTLRSIIARVAKLTPGEVDEAATLGDALGLGSLDLVEVVVSVEDELGIALDEEVKAGLTVGELRQCVARRQCPLTPPATVAQTAATQVRPLSGWRGSLRMPRWAASLPAHAFRRAMEEAILFPLVHWYSRPVVEGLEHLSDVDPPYLIVSNHRSHFDASVIKACLSAKVGGRIAPGMTTKWERVFFGEETASFRRYLGESVEATLIQLLFHAWPISPAVGLRRSLAYAGELADAGFSILLFPEGRHVPTGVMEHFREGTGIFARELRLPVVPIYLEGTEQIIPEGDPWYRFRHGRVRMVLGHPLSIDSETEGAALTQLIQDEVRALAPPQLTVVARALPGDD
jgi:long-chain acyl-CoA synthetase